ncbi:DUF91 domain-containing protein [Thermoplasmatota archaeon]
MPINARIWEITENDGLKEIKRPKLNLEVRIENWLENDITTISDDLLIIGRQVETDFGGIIDLLCLDRDGDTVIVELKRDKTPRDITAQVIDYASWVKDLSNERITEIADKYLMNVTSLEDHFKNQFGEELPETLNEEHNMLIVASEIDPSSERIINYLSDSYGIGINAVTFQYFKEKEKEYLARVYLIEPSEVEYKTKTKAPSKRKPNLSFDELEEIANNNGVGDLYKMFIDKLNPHFETIRRTRTSIAFVGQFGESKYAIFNLIPTESNTDFGLKFQVYVNRFSEYFKIDKNKLIELLPKNKKEWRYYPEASDEYSGYEGFFKDETEVKIFYKVFKK